MRKLDFSKFLSCRHFPLIIARGLAWGWLPRVFLKGDGSPDSHLLLNSHLGLGVVLLLLLRKEGLASLEGLVCRVVHATHGTDDRV